SGRVDVDGEAANRGVAGAVPGENGEIVESGFRRNSAEDSGARERNARRREVDRLEGPGDGASRSGSHERLAIRCSHVAVRQTGGGRYGQRRNNEPELPRSRIAEVNLVGDGDRERVGPGRGGGPAQQAPSAEGYAGGQCAAGQRPGIRRHAAGAE